MKILLAEDDPSIQAIAKLALSKTGGHTVSVVKDGREVLEFVSKDKPDLILLDVMMPILDGFQTCIQLKQNDTTKQIPIIFLTAKAQSHEVQHGMNLGAIGYILKPFDPMTLDNEIKLLFHKGTP
ncbi:MAG: response regulator [Bacteriovoracia bacterium]